MRWLFLCFIPWWAQAETTSLREISGLNLITGQTLSIPLTQRNTVVVFLSTRCPCSKSHIPYLNQLAREWSPEFSFVGIHSNANESLLESKEYFQHEVKLTFPILHDPQSTLANALGALKTPHVFIISSDQKILFKGGIDDSHLATHAKRFYLKNTLLAIHAHQAIPEPQVRVLGCEIQRP